MIQIFHGGEPYIVFTKNFFFDLEKDEIVNLKNHKKEEITEEFIKRGFVIGNYTIDTDN